MKLDEIDLKLLRRALLGQIFPSTPRQEKRLERLSGGRFVTRELAQYRDEEYRYVYGITAAGRVELEKPRNECPRPKTGCCGEKWSNEPPCPYRPGPSCGTSSS